AFRAALEIERALAGGCASAHAVEIRTDGAGSGRSEKTRRARENRSRNARRIRQREILSAGDWIENRAEGRREKGRQRQLSHARRSLQNACKKPKLRRARR